MKRRWLVISLAAILLTATVAITSIIRCRVVPVQSDCTEADLQALRSLEQAFERNAQSFNGHERALLDFFASHQNGQDEFTSATRAHWLAGIMANDMRFASTLAEVYGNVCSGSDRARIHIIIDHHLSYILESFQIPETWINRLVSTAPNDEMKTTSMQLNNDLAEARTLLFSLRERLAHTPLK
jgi:hypothetical protein